MREIIIIRTENSQPIKQVLNNQQIKYEIYQEPTTKNIIDEEREKLIEQYKRSAKTD
jgi:hypothetical protein